LKYLQGFSTEEKTVVSYIRKRSAELGVGVLLGITGMLLAVVAAVAQASTSSPYPLSPFSQRK